MDVSTVGLGTPPGSRTVAKLRQSWIGDSEMLVLVKICHLLMILEQLAVDCPRPTHVSKI